MYTVSLGAAELRMKDTYSNANAKLDIPSSATTAVLPYRRCLVEGCILRIVRGDCRKDGGEEGDGDGDGR